MALFSTVLRNHMLAGGDLKGQFANFELRIYSADSTPANAEDALPGGAVLMYTFDDLNFETDAEDGLLPKADAETWTANCLANGTMRFFRCVAPPDTGAGEGATAPRIQGTIGTYNADLIAATLTKEETDPLTINFFGVVLPGTGHAGVVGGLE
jgi:hypothetical protein